MAGLHRRVHGSVLLNHPAPHEGTLRRRSAAVRLPEDRRTDRLGSPSEQLGTGARSTGRPAGDSGPRSPVAACRTVTAVHGSWTVRSQRARASRPAPSTAVPAPNTAPYPVRSRTTALSAPRIRTRIRPPRGFAPDSSVPSRTEKQHRPNSLERGAQAGPGSHRSAIRGKQSHQRRQGTRPARRGPWHDLLGGTARELEPEHRQCRRLLRRARHPPESPYRKRDTVRPSGPRPGRRPSCLGTSSACSTSPSPHATNPECAARSPRTTRRGIPPPVARVPLSTPARTRAATSPLSRPSPSPPAFRGGMGREHPHPRLCRRVMVNRRPRALVPRTDPEHPGLLLGPSSTSDYDATPTAYGIGLRGHLLALDQEETEI